MMRNILVLSAIVLIAGLTVRADEYFRQDRRADDVARSEDIVYRMLGELREVVSAKFVLKADEYFHGGTRHSEGEECHHEADTCSDDDHPRHAAAGSHLAGRRGFWEWLHAEIYDRPAYHLEGRRRAEALPWFYLATRVDPRNVDAYVLGGYWLGQVLHKPARAIEFLEEGLRHNPGDWQLYGQLGDIYYIVEGDYVQAVEAFQRAYQALPADISAFELRHILTLLTAAAERAGWHDQAAVYQRRLEELFPAPEVAPSRNVPGDSDCQEASHAHGHT